MNRENIIKWASYDLLSRYLNIPKQTIKKWFNNHTTKKDISNPHDVARYLDLKLYNRWWVYKITNKINWLMYIWQSCNIASRWDSHKISLKSNKHTNKKMQEDYNLFWFEAFEYSIVCFEQDKNIREEMELKTIQWYWYSKLYNYTNMVELYKLFTKEEIDKIADNTDKIKYFLSTI